MLEKNKTLHKALYMARLHQVKDATQQERPDKRGTVILPGRRWQEL